MTALKENAGFKSFAELIIFGFIKYSVLYLSWQINKILLFNPQKSIS